MASSSPSHAERIATVTVSTKDWVTRATTEHTIEIQKKIVAFLIRAYGSLLLASVAIFLFQGFALWGFKLSETVLKFIGTATIGEIGGLLALTFRTVFKK
ncbi:MAG: hypothetical protein ABSH09_17965 [Bryobacteraceae bacterium]|jgi:uncharacterized protein (DUF697 family)